MASVMVRTVAATTLILLLIGPATAAQGKVLVLLDDLELKSSVSSFLDILKGRGYELDVRAIDDASLQLRQWEEWLYDKLVIFGSSKGEQRCCPLCP